MTTSLRDQTRVAEGIHARSRLATAGRGRVGLAGLLLAGTVLAGTVLASTVLAGAVGAQSAATHEDARTPDRRPDLNGIWQALGTAHWDLEAHSARPGPIAALGALGAIPAGLGVVEGGRIPYQPWAEKQRAENLANWLALHPAVKCFMPGIPRATYMPFPFQIVQGENAVLFAYEFTSSSRVVRLDRAGSEAPLSSWMGYGLGRYEGDTLVVQVTAQEPSTWFDSSGNFHSDELEVEERYTRTGPGTMLYEATITDPKVFTRPWKISLPLYRRAEPNAQLLEFKCVPFAEEVVYGEHIKRSSSPK